MPNFISMRANSSGHVDITLDLSHYINAYEKAYGTNVPIGPAQATAATADALAHDHAATRPGVVVSRHLRRGGG